MFANDAGACTQAWAWTVHAYADPKQNFTLDQNVR